MVEWNKDPYEESPKQKDLTSLPGKAIRVVDSVLEGIDTLPKDQVVATIKNRLSQLLADTEIDGWAVFSATRQFRFSKDGRDYIFSFASKVDTVYKERREALNKALGSTDEERRSDKWPLS